MECKKEKQYNKTYDSLFIEKILTSIEGKWEPTVITWYYIGSVLAQTNLILKRVVQIEWNSVKPDILATLDSVSCKFCRHFTT